MAASEQNSASSFSFGEGCSRLTRWCARAPLQAALLAGCIATFIVFFFAVPLWRNGEQSTYTWVALAWNLGTGEQFHGRFVAFGSIILVWLHRQRIAAAPKCGSNLGLIVVAFGILLFVLGARCVQPRAALLAIPFLFYGATLFLWGREVARIVLFPCAFLVFMIPVAFLEQSTFQLQFVITSAIGFLAKLIGVSLQAVGTTVTARDGSFNFEIAGGCSGIHSLMAMSMITAVYVHLSQDEMWKKVVIFGASLVFALIGNIGRLFTVILVARFIDPKLASGIVHDYSGFIFFPVALMAMTGFGRIVNLDWKRIAASALKPETPTRIESEAATPATEPARKTPSSISYDY